MKEKKIQELNNLVRTSYDSIATHFDLTRKKRVWPQIEEYCKRVKEGEAVLDLACGNGRLLGSLFDKKINYLGIDVSSQLINIAQKNYPKHKFIVGNVLDIESILEKGESYDYIFFLAALQHIPGHKNRLELLKKIKNYLNDSGVLVISNWNLWSSKHRFRIIKAGVYKLLGLNKLNFGDIIFFWKDAKGENRAKRYYHAFTKRELLFLAKKSGFEQISLKKDKYNYWLELKK
ncbi:MAG: class I SAM-dependent methyltransferase [Patescibacteria group bacterium]|nr:class I SAM-dependent methyltransferase [Patescibacteria group bacterium]MDD4443499.1 class I SAM-dependent methyltransferase [Patescibacteria group bacterium]NCU39585.1 class I SAM-dependent methyltransferase [Candidatus Falkowbacteria bacterium]